MFMWNDRIEKSQKFHQCRHRNSRCSKDLFYFKCLEKVLSVRAYGRTRIGTKVHFSVKCKNHLSSPPLFKGCVGHITREEYDALEVIESLFQNQGTSLRTA